MTPFIQHNTTGHLDDTEDQRGKWRTRALLALWLLACVLIPLWLVGCGGGDEPVAPAAVTKAIGASGGSITGPDGVVLSIPADALSTTTTFRIARNDAGAPPLVGLRPISGIYEVTPHGSEFASSARIQIPYDAAQVPAGARAILIRAQPGGEWAMIDAQDQGAAMLAGDTPGLSFYAVGTCYTSALASVPGPDPLVACPAAHSLSIVILDGTTAVPVVRDVVTGVVLPVMTISTPTRLRVGIRYTRPPSGREDYLSMGARAGGGASITPNDWPRALPFGTDIGTLYAGLQTERNIDIDPATVPGASQPGGVIVRFRATVSTEFDAFYPGCFCFKKAAWTYEAEIPVRVIGTATLPVTYSVGGNVTGLTGTGLVLQNNGGGNLAINSNGPFTFASPLTAGTAYAVTVLNQPSGQVCSVGNGAGSVSGNVTTPAVSCIQLTTTNAWQGAALLENETGEALGPDIAMDGNGYGMAIWQQYVPAVSSKYQIWTRRYVPATGWDAPEMIQAPNDYLNFSEPRIAFDSIGNAFAVFHGYNSEYSEVWAARYTASTNSWGTATQVSDNGDAPQIAMDGAGNAFVVWQQSDLAQHSNIAFARYNASNSLWSTPQVIDNDPSAVYYPQIAVDPGGNAAVIWTTADSGDVRATRLNVGGGWSAEVSIGAPAPALAVSQYRIAYSPAENAFIAVWNQYDGNAYSVYTRRLMNNNWGALSLVESSSDEAREAEIAVDGVGNASVVWIQQDANGHLSAWARRYTYGIAGSAQRVDNGSSYTSGGNVHIATSASGTGVAVWTQASRVWSNRFVPGAGWTGTQTIDSQATSGSVGASRVATNPSGNALAVWQNVGTTSDIWRNGWK